MDKPDKLEDVAARLGISPAELERRNDEHRAVITRRIASVGFPPGYEPGYQLVRFPDAHAVAMGERRPLWVKPGRGRPALTSPLLVAVEAEEARRLALIGENRRKPAAVKASAAAAANRAEKSAAVRAEVEKMTKAGKRPHTIAYTLGITARRVNQILAASKK